MNLVYLAIALPVLLISGSAYSAENALSCQRLVDTELQTYESEHHRSVDPSKTRITAQRGPGDLTTYFDKRGNVVLTFRAAGLYSSHEQTIVSFARRGLITRFSLIDCGLFQAREAGSTPAIRISDPSYQYSVVFDHRSCRQTRFVSTDLVDEDFLKAHPSIERVCESYGSDLTGL